MFLGALIATGLALQAGSTAPLISGGVYPKEVADVLVLYGGGAGDEAQRRLVDVLRRRPEDERAWGVLLALWWRRPPSPERIDPVLAAAPPVVRELAAALWPAETAVGEESKEQRLARIGPSLSEAVARHAASPLAHGIDCYVRSETTPEAALAACRAVLRLDPAMLPAVRGELFALSALGRANELDPAVWLALKSYPEDLGVALRFFEETRPPAPHAERWPVLSPFLALKDAHPLGLRALERLLDDATSEPFADGQLRVLLQSISGGSDWWVQARLRLLTYLTAHPDHLADPSVRAFVIACDRTLAERRLPYPSTEQRQSRALAAQALLADGNPEASGRLAREMSARLRPVHRAAFDALVSGVPPLALPPLAEMMQPLFDRQGSAVRLAPSDRPRIVVITRGECRWTRRVAKELAGRDVTWISQDLPEAQGRALEFLQASGIDASKVLFTRAPGLAADASADGRLGIEVSPDLFLFAPDGTLAREWEGWPVGGIRAVLDPELDRLAAGATGVLRGTIVEAGTGVAIDGAQVIAELPGGTVTVEAGAGGKFEFQGVPDVWLSVTASKPGVGWGRERMRASAGEAAVRLHPVGSIVGRAPVIDAAAAAAAAAGAVRVPGLGRRSPVGSDGTFRLDDVPVGETRVEWVRPDPAQVRVTSVQVRAGEESEAVFAAGASVAGRVTLEGEPVSGARMTWVRWEGERPGGNLPTGLASVIAGEDGTYALEGLEAGHYTVSVTVGASGALREALLLDDREQTFDVALRGEPVAGTVLDAATSAPIAGASLFAYDGSRTFAPVVRRWSLDDAGVAPVAQAAGALNSATTDASGKFELLVDRSSSALEVRAEGYLPLDRTLDPKDASWAARSLRLSRAATVSGVLLDETGRTVANGSVFVRFDAIAGFGAHAISREDGTFQFDQVPAGRYDLVAAVDGRLAVVEGNATAEPDAAKLVVRLADGGALEVRGAVPAGTPTPGNLPRLVGATGRDVVQLLAVADDARVMPRLQPAEGGWTLRLPLVPPGEYVVRTAIGRAIEARVSPSEITAVDLRLP